MNTHTLHIALPVLGEFANLHNFFKCIKSQSFKNYKIYVCVNQFDSWWSNHDKKHYCIDNAQSLEFLKSQNNENLAIIDRSTKGSGWPDKKGGVGWARKILMDTISTENKNDIIVSMDADTFYPDNYLLSISQHFNEYPEHLGISIPYFHKLKGDDTDKHILRYEIYMRYYALNMLRIQNPYNFTALGSALALPLWAYNKIGGMTPAKSGEDFYLLQKLVKNGKIGQWIETTAYPSSRFSDRVLFGTGPAVIKGAQGDWTSYPLYFSKSFDLVKQTYDLFPELYKKDIETPMTAFLQDQLKANELWEPLRKNYKDQANFIKACINKVDGLRILQFLRFQNSKLDSINNEQILKDYLSDYFFDNIDSSLYNILKKLDFNSSTVNELDYLRKYLYSEEMKLRKKTEDS